MTATDTPATTLRRAAAHLRALATAPGITPPPWLSMDGGDRLLHDGPGAESEPPQYVVDEPMSNSDNAAYIAAVHPGLGRALADWLDHEAGLAEQAVYGGLDALLARRPLEVARQLLGEVTC